MKERMQGMTMPQKIDYLWTYYKIWLLVPVFIGVILNLVCSAYRAGQENNLVSAVVIGGGNSDTREFESGLKKYMNQTGKNDTVTLQTNIVESELTPDTMSVLTTLIGAAAADVFVCPENVYDHFSERQAFVDMREVLGDSMAQYGDIKLSEKGDAVVVGASEFLQEQLGTLYEEVYIGVLATNKHGAGKAAFVQYVLENTQNTFKS